MKYGDKKINLALDSKNVIGLITALPNQGLKNPLDKMGKLLDEPINCPSLNQLIKDKKAKRILIVVNDITRHTPYDVFLPPLLAKLEQSGIQKENIIFIVANGSHRGNTKSENERVFGEQIVSTYHFTNHDGDDQRLIDLGKMKSGNHLWVDPVVKKTDFIITTGVIVPHYIAGFSGGRKSILPGICGRETIEKNHANMVHSKAFTGNLINNPVHQEMIESIELVNVDFNINAITDEEGGMIDIVAGDIVASWEVGVKICQQTYFSPIHKKAEVVIVSTGGYPKDINMYQAQKALENAYQAVQPAGTIILLAECREGFGNTIFEQWIEEAGSIEDVEKRIKKRFILGGHKAYAIARVAKEVEIILVSSLHEQKVRKLFMIPAKDIQEALGYVQQKHGKNFQSYIIPSGNTVVPMLEEEDRIKRN